MSSHKKNRQIIIDFVVSCLENGEQRSTILAKVVQKWQMSARTFDRILKNANEAHSNKRRLIQNELDKVDVQSAIEARKKSIMTADERKEYLTKLILGEIEVPYTEVKWDKNQSKFVTIKFIELAGHTARVSAIAELNKMEGDYAPTKIANTDKEGNDVKPLNDTELDKVLSKIDQLLPK